MISEVVLPERFTGMNMNIGYIQPYCANLKKLTIERSRYVESPENVGQTEEWWLSSPEAEQGLSLAWKKELEDGQAGQLLNNLYKRKGNHRACTVEVITRVYLADHDYMLVSH